MEAFFRGVRIKISRMLVNVSVNRLNSDRVQICVAKPQANPSPVQTYPSIDAARRVLLEFGIDENDPPGGGVHGMWGFHAAKVALSKLGARGRRSWVASRLKLSSKASTLIERSKIAPPSPKLLESATGRGRRAHALRGPLSRTQSRYSS